MMKDIVYYISSNQEVGANAEIELCSSAEVWAKAQLYVDEHMVCLGNGLYSFPNKRFFEQNFKEINKQILENHLQANKYAKTLENYMKRRCLWVYNHKKKVSFLCFFS